ncbi:MAG: MerR family transcriptional regulator [Methylocystaceae bacterium]|nr:MAG: MerR family transcriptional regulator [Methylocystaceae bacterium]
MGNSRESIGASTVTGKSEGAFRTIGEVAESLDLPQHVLRFWETRFDEIEPIKRAGGRRYYRPRDVELVAAIRHMLYGQGYTIKGVQRILKEQGVRAVIEGARGLGPRFVEEAASPLRRAGERDSTLFERAETSLSPPEEEDNAVLFQDAPPSAPQAPTFESPGTSLVAVASPRPQATLTLPAVRILEVAHGAKLGAEDARRLRDALDDLAECRRMLELTRRWDR